MREPDPSDMLLVRHTIKVNGQVVYAGEDWTKAQTIFVQHVQNLDLVHVEHIAQKQAVPLYHDPRAIVWDEV